jgi:hypothetical protein
MIILVKLPKKTKLLSIKMNLLRLDAKISTEIASVNHLTKIDQNRFINKINSKL